MKVKCLLCGVLGVTEGKEYEVIKGEYEGYAVINDYGCELNYYKWVFENTNMQSSL